MTSPSFAIRPVGHVESVLTDRTSAPCQGDEGAPDAWLVFTDEMAEAIQGLAVGDDIIVLTWFDRADQETLWVHPRGDVTRPATGVFNTRSPDRPNPIGLHRVTVLAIEGTRMQVNNLEALDQTPIVDVKPVIGSINER